MIHTVAAGCGLDLHGSNAVASLKLDLPPHLARVLFDLHGSNAVASLKLSEFHHASAHVILISTAAMPWPH